MKQQHSPFVDHFLRAQLWDEHVQLILLIITSRVIWYQPLKVYL
jgi:hypothetical protein